MEQEAVTVQSFYYGRIGSEATETLLGRFGHDGSFLLRDSETMQGAYCLCVRRAPFVHTYRLVRCADGWCLQSAGTRQLRFRTLENLIENFRSRSAPNDVIVPLTEPLVRTQTQALGSGQEFAYMEMSSSSSSVY